MGESPQKAVQKFHLRLLPPQRFPAIVRVKVAVTEEEVAVALPVQAQVVEGCRDLCAVLHRAREWREHVYTRPAIENNTYYMNLHCLLGWRQKVSDFFNGPEIY